MTTPDEQDLARQDEADGFGPLLQFFDDYYSPWGGWKTAWWEHTVGDDVPFSDEAALRYVRKLTTATARSVAHQLVAERLRSSVLVEALRVLDAYLDFSEPIDPGEWGVDDPSGLNEAFAQALDALAQAEARDQ